MGQPLQLSYRRQDLPHEVQSDDIARIRKEQESGTNIIEITTLLENPSFETISVGLKYSLSLSSTAKVT